MSGPWLRVVGIGADGLDGLGAAARAALAEAELVVGGARHLAMLPDHDRRPRQAWLSPLALTMEILERLRGRPVAVLASGDPLWFGVGRLILRHFPAPEVSVIPQAGAFQLAAARLGWAQETVTAISLHGRDPSTLRRWLQPGRRLLALSADGRTPAAVAAILVEAGFGPSRLVVLEELGGPRERVTGMSAAGWLRHGTAVGGTPAMAGAGRRPVAASAADAGPFSDLNLLAISPQAADGTEPLPSLPGLPDTAFEHDGQLTKAEVRAMTLAALAPLPGQHLWDIGAGAGSIAVEWLRSGPAMRSTAVERDPTRCLRLRRNASRLGAADGLKVVAGSAPACLGELEPPDAAFVGGGVADLELLERVWAALPPGGRLVVNAVTLAGEAALLALGARLGGRLTRIALSRAEAVGTELAWRPALPVTQFAARKSMHETSCNAAS